MVLDDSHEGLLFTMGVFVSDQSVGTTARCIRDRARVQRSPLMPRDTRVSRETVAVSIALHVLNAPLIAAYSVEAGAHCALEAS